MRSLEPSFEARFAVTSGWGAGWDDAIS